MPASDATGSHDRRREGHRAHAPLLERGATTFGPVIQCGGGFATASVVDPFGNVLGLIQSPRWAARRPSRLAQRP